MSLASRPVLISFIFPVILGSFKSKKRPFVLRYSSKPFKNKKITSSASIIRIGFSLFNDKELI